MKKIGVIGLGRVGKTAAKILLEHDSIAELMIYSLETGDREMGYLEELQQVNRHCVKINLSTGIKKLREADIILLCAGFDYSGLTKNRVVESQWQVVTPELEYNLAAVKDIFNQLIPLRDKILLVYTNPVDIICCVIAGLIDKSNRILGFGVNLDTLRLRNLVKPGTFVIGEHGNTMVPVGISQNKTRIIEAREKVLVSISRVTAWQGYTLVGPEFASRELFKALLGNCPSSLPLSVYDKKNDIFIGGLLNFRGNTIKYQALPLNDAEQELYRESILKIKQEVGNIKK
ncbi:MAG: hypothetical protein PVH61_10300 [Candidatus Aminicenantes bacterium]|jgi:malate/lactate dehydrogenase